MVIFNKFNLKKYTINTYVRGIIDAFVKRNKYVNVMNSEECDVPEYGRD